MKHALIAMLSLISFLLLSTHCRVTNNPRNIKKPKGIVGRTVEDAQKAQKDFYDIFSNPNFSEFRKLFILDSNAIRPIDSADITKALQGKTLTRDEQVLLEITVATINSNFEYKVEYVGEADSISPEAEKLFGKDLVASGMIIQNVKDTYPCHCISGLVFGSTLGGSGNTLKTSTGSYSVIVASDDPTLSANDYYYAEKDSFIFNPILGTLLITGHEILGHGRSLSLNYSNQHEAGILTENLILRLLGMQMHIQRTGALHGKKSAGGKRVIDGYDTRLPGFR